MNTADLEVRVRDVFARQAAALHPPDVRPDDAVVVVGSPRGDRRPRGRLLVAAAAAVMLISGGIVIANRDTGEEPGAGSETTNGFHFATAQVQLDADSVEVDAGGRTFVPPADTMINSDPGTPNEYTTLELEWDAQGVPMRINIYFASDGTDWWATEIRTYDGSPSGEWIEMPGEYFRSAIGAAYTGDLDLPSLHIHGLRLEAFRRPAACDFPDKPLALVSDWAQIDVAAAPNGDFAYAATAKLIDTATCLPTSISDVVVSITSDNPDIATVREGTPVVSDPRIGVIRIELALPNAGATTIHVAVSDKTTNELIDQVDIPVIVHPAA